MLWSDHSGGWEEWVPPPGSREISGGHCRGLPRAFSEPQGLQPSLQNFQGQEGGKGMEVRDTEHGK